MFIVLAIQADSQFKHIKLIIEPNIRVNCKNNHIGIISGRIKLFPCLLYKLSDPLLFITVIPGN